MKKTNITGKVSLHIINTKMMKMMICTKGFRKWIISFIDYLTLSKKEYISNKSHIT